MRCKDARVSPPIQGSTNIGCGEWDYSNNTFIHDPTKTDSILNTTPRYQITNFEGDEFSYSLTPIHDYMGYKRQVRTIANIESEESFEVLGASTNSISIAPDNNGKLSFNLNAEELIASGFTAGPMHGIRLTGMQDGSIHNMEIRLALADDGDSYTDYIDTTYSRELVFSGDYDFVEGDNSIYFAEIYQWDGTSDLIVEMSFTSGRKGDEIILRSSDQNGLISNIGEYHIDLTAGGMVELSPADLSDIEDEITIAFWANGDTDQLPRNTSVIHALDDSGERSLNIHFPWGNGNIYWDAGGEGPGYDRIEKPAAKELYAGSWAHWAFTKNTTTGIMNIFRNGELWHTGNGMAQKLEIAEMVIGASNNGANPYKGLIDEFTIWDKALSADEITDIMSIKANQAVDHEEDLIVYYDFNERDAEVCTNQAIEGENGTYNAQVFWKYNLGNEIDKHFETEGLLPAISLLRGSYEGSTRTETYNIRVERTPNYVIENTIIPMFGEAKHDSIASSEVRKVWESIPAKMIDAESGSVVGIISKVADGTYVMESLPYYQRWVSKFEIMSFVTPYGINLDMGEQGETWTFDITEMLPILKDQRRMTMEYGGQRQEDMDVRFLFIVGTPPADVIDIDQMWRNRSRNNGQITSDQAFPPRQYYIDPEADRYVVKSTITGHGQQGEFIPRNHHIEVGEDNPERFEWQVWAECSENPIYPQGGTWIYDRAGWCPGEASKIQLSDITPYVTKGEYATIDYGMEAATGDSRYIVNHQLITYGAPNHQIDATIADVIEPTTKIEYARFNPSINVPKIVLKNTGAENLQSAKIIYWINDSNEKRTFDWTGDLEFLDEETVELPTDRLFWAGMNEEGNVFHAEVEVNNDEYSSNDIYHSSFNPTELLPAHLKFVVRTNGAGNEITHRLLDEDGNEIFSTSNLASYTTNNEEVTLAIGHYTYEIIDSDDDGLSFFANNDGNGFAFVRNNLTNSILKEFEPDFGGIMRFNFSVEDPTTVAEANNAKVGIYPNPASDLLNINFKEQVGTFEYRILDLEGRTLLTGSATQGVPVSTLTPGYYSIQVKYGDGKTYRQGFVME
jgi:hypothetical protein